MYLSTATIIIFSVVYYFIAYLTLSSEAWFWTFMVTVSLAGLSIIAPERKIWRVVEVLKGISRLEVIFLTFFSAVGLKFSDSVGANIIRWFSIFTLFLSFRLISSRFVKWYWARREENSK